MSNERAILLSSRQITAFVVGTWMSLFIMQEKAACASPQWRMIPFEIDGVKDARVGGFALGSDGTPWAIPAEPAYEACYYLQDGAWHKMAGDAYWWRLGVSPTGDVYVCQHKSHQTSEIYWLKDKHAVYVADFDVDERSGQANLYFDTKGRIWNWGKSFFAKFENGQWEKVDVHAGELPHIIEDSRGNVYLFGTTLSYYRDGRFTVDCNLPSFVSKGSGLRACRWGEDKALISSSGTAEVLAIDLNTLEANYVVRGQPSPPTMGFYDPFRDREGNVWLLTADHPNYPERYYTVLSARDGTLSKKAETAVMEWDEVGMYDHNDRRSVLCASDGTIYFGVPGNGVYIYQAGKVTHTDWRDGVQITSTRFVYEHPDGTIWFASPRTGIAVYDPKGEKTSLPRGFRDTWTQFDLRNRATIWDFDNRVCACLADEPGRVSRWDGNAWTHTDVPFDPKGMSEWLIDNLGVMYFMVQEGARRSVYQIHKGNVRQFETIRIALVAAVKEGATEFRSADPFRQSTAPVVTQDKYILSQTEWLQGLAWYDGRYWNGSGSTIEGIVKYTDDQVLIRNRDRFYRFNRGQMTELTNEYSMNGEYLLSEIGLIPFNEGMYETNEDRLFPACIVQEMTCVFTDPNALHEFDQRKVPAEKTGISWDPREIWIAKGGFWSHTSSRLELSR